MGEVEDKATARWKEEGHVLIADSMGGNYEGMTPDEMECEILKVAITMPDLFNTMREIFLNHPMPDKLDPTGRLLREIYKRLERASDGSQTANR